MMSSEKKLNNEQLKGVTGGTNYETDKEWSINGDNQIETDPMKKTNEENN